MKYYLAIFTIVLVLSTAINCDDNKNSPNPSTNLQKTKKSAATTNNLEVIKKKIRKFK